MTSARPPDPVAGAAEVAPAMVVGIGNRHRGDDAVGPLVIDRLEKRLPAGRTPPKPALVVVDGDLCDLSLRWQADQAVVIVDALHSGREPGAIVTIDGLRTPLRSGRETVSGREPLSSHGIGLAEAIELGRHLGRLPRSLTIVGIEGATFDHGAALSRPVAAAVDEVAERIEVLIGIDPAAGTGRPGGGQPVSTAVPTWTDP